MAIIKANTLQDNENVKFTSCIVKNPFWIWQLSDDYPFLQEHKLYVEVTTALCEDRIVWREDGVPLIRSKENPEEYY